jgi:hypothetical protein
MSGDERKGYPLRDEYLARQRGFARLQRLEESSVYVSKAVEAYAHRLFDYTRRSPHFEVQCRDQAAAQWVHDNCLERWRDDDGYSRIGELTEVLRSLVHAVCTFGRSFCAIDFADSADGYLRFGKPRWLAVETVTPRFRFGQVTGFVQQYTRHAEDEEAKGTRFEFARDEVLWLQWPQTLPPGRMGASPLTRVLKDAGKADEFLGWMNLHAYAGTHPENHRFEVERARYGSFDREKQRHERRVARVLSRMGVPQIFWLGTQRPMTDYFLTWELCEFGKRVSYLREYLLDEFNRQVLGAWARRNGLSEMPVIRTVGYPSPDDWQRIFAEYTRGERTTESVSNILHHGLA